MMTLARDLVSLLQGCKDAPDEDVPRLILADWLEEQGETDRAEFVRLSVRLSGGEVPLRDEAVTLAGRHGLYSRDANCWLGECQWRVMGVTLQRGLLRLDCSLSVLRGLASSAPPDVAPWLETFALPRDQEVSDLLDVPTLRHFTGLDLRR